MDLKYEFSFVPPLLKLDVNVNPFGIHFSTQISQCLEFFVWKKHSDLKAKSDLLLSNLLVLFNYLLSSPVIMSMK